MAHPLPPLARYPTMHALAPLALLALATAPAPAASPTFDPIAFFTGYTEGAGDLKIALRPATAMQVHGHGSVDPDGTLVLDQRVEQHGKPTRNREWRIRRTGATRYTGTLTDAVGAVTGDTVGDRFHISYRMKGHLGVDQWLTLAPDGRSAHNVMRVRLHGVPVAHLDETIRRTGG